ncbi:MAG: OB-fold nucleic acid binding domain-containing protein [Anaerolineae bacterium]|nr:OB-fold nucleic acid binding domain-containing protein [Anaerolineae bacterium]
MKKRLSVRVVKIYSLCFASIGLILLWWLASHTEISLVSVNEIQGMMNFATVRIAGRVIRRINYDTETQYLGFWVDDGTGEIYVSTYGNITQGLLEMGTLPAPGDEVSLVGTLRLREDYAAITLNDPADLAIFRPAPTALRSIDVSPLDEGRRVVIQGEVVSLLTPYSGLDLVIIQDAAGEIAVAIEQVVKELTGNTPEFTVGHGVMVTGTVSLYKGTPQVTLVDSDELTVLANPNDPESQVRLISNINLSELGSQVLVQGKVVAMEGIKGGLRAVLDDGTGQIVLVLWERTYSALDDPANLDLGAAITINGEVSAYEGALEIIPHQASDITIQSPASEVPWINIESLSRSDRGRLIRIRGILGKPTGFSSGVKFPLRDGSGRITVLLWSNIYQELKPRPVEDMLVEVKGIIDIFNDKLEITPRSTYDVINLDQGD